MPHRANVDGLPALVDDGRVLQLPRFAVARVELHGSERPGRAMTADRHTYPRYCSVKKLVRDLEHAIDGDPVALLEVERMLALLQLY